MEVAVVAPPPPPTPMNFNFHSNCSSPYMITAPSSPQRFCNEQLNNYTNNNNDGSEDFEFDFSGHLQRPSLSADELFDGGKIRLLNPTTSNIPSSAEKNIAKVAIDKKDSHELVVGRHPTSTESRWGKSRHDPKHLIMGLSNGSNGFSSVQRGKQQERGRQRDSSSSYDNSNKDKGASSLISESAVSSATSTYCASLLSSNWFAKRYRKWKLKDFLLFRSASEGRGTDKDPLRKYSALSKTAVCEDVGNCSFRSKTAAYEDVGSCSFRSKTAACEDVGNSSFRSKTTAYEDVGSWSFRSTDEGSGSVSRRRVSAHELHYTVNRAASEELKKKTLLPYRHGLLGCLRFNTGTGSGIHYISTGIGSLERS